MLGSGVALLRRKQTSATTFWGRGSGPQALRPKRPAPSPFPLANMADPNEVFRSHTVAVGRGSNKQNWDSSINYDAVDKWDNHGGAIDTRSADRDENRYGTSAVALETGEVAQRKSAITSMMDSGVTRDEEGGVHGVDEEGGGAHGDGAPCIPPGAARRAVLVAALGCARVRGSLRRAAPDGWFVVAFVRSVAAECWGLLIRLLRRTLYMF